MKIDGKQIASDILNQLKNEVAKLQAKGITPTMAVILMGDNESSVAYIKQKEIKAKEIGAEVKVFQFNEDVSNQEIEDLVKKLDADSNIHGIILQRPAPDQIKVDELEELISPDKEVDGFGKNAVYPIPVAEAVWRLITSVIDEDNLPSKKVVVLGKGETAGQPIIDYLFKKGLNPTVIDSKTENRKELLNTADVVISAVGKQNVLNSAEIQRGAIIIGVGLTTDNEGKLKGDFENDDLNGVASYYSPTPGGVGPVNVAILMENLVKAANQAGISET
jgi:methylenetetrahydrofolate dehydrogenase (NADP+) / methenyltetrahydrofolate cyclohydrolase